MKHIRTCLLVLPLLATVVAPLNAQVRVGLCAAAGSLTACQWNTTRAALVATGYFSAVDIIDVTAAGGGTPALSTLLQYDALLCWTNTTPANNVTWGDVLADYVDAGGGVVVAVFANSSTSTGRNIDGRWQNGYEVILDRTGSASGAGATLGNVLVPGHPSLAGVAQFTGGTIGSRPVGTTLEVGAYVVAEWSDGKVLIAQGANPNRIDLGFYPVPASCSQSGWATGGDQIMANSLLAVASGATFGPYGAGCAGSLGAPTWAAQPGSRPVIGGVLDTNLANLPFGVGLIGLGASNTTSGGLPLPLDLTVIGMPGCSLLADPVATNTVIGVGTTATWSLPVPAAPSLVGAVLYGQGFALDPGVNAFGFTASNAGRIKIGV